MLGKSMAGFSKYICSTGQEQWHKYMESVCSGSHQQVNQYPEQTCRNR